ncbi:MAG: hypothetical protein ACYC4L_00710 [Chloroflexota bacterium]
MQQVPAGEIDQLPIDELPALTAILERHWPQLAAGEAGQVVAGTMYCPQCDGVRAMRIVVRYAPDLLEGRTVVLPGALPSFVPALLGLNCVQCGLPFTLVVYEGPDGPLLAVLPHRQASPATRHTPPVVAFYLDQAQRAESAGASSAAVAMFRLALETLLAEQGYVTGSLAMRLHQLSNGVETNAAPAWALELAPEFHSVLRQLGEAGFAGQSFDAQRQSQADGTLHSLLVETFPVLLFLVYEVPQVKNERLAALRLKSQMLQR